MHRLKATSLSRVIDRSYSEVYFFHCDDLRFIYANNGARTNLGYSVEELEKLTPVDIKPEFTEKRFRELLQPLLDGSERVIRFETYHKRKDGSSYIVEVSVEVDDTEVGKAFIAMIRDITRDVTERRAKDALLEDLDHFSKFVSHDIVAPIRQGLFFCNELERKYPDEDDVQKLKQVLGQARTMVRAFTILHEGQRTSYGFNHQSVEAIVEEARGAISSSHAGLFTLASLDCDATVFCDRSLVVQVFKNLFENAVKYRRLPDVSVSVAYQSCDEMLIITVADNGAGIARENFSRIFDLQFREKRSDDIEGSGVGLAICKKIMRHHGGAIRVQDSDETGTVFALEFPRTRVSPVFGS